MAQSSTYAVLARQRTGARRTAPAAPACTDRADFLRRIGERRGVHTGLPSPADPED